ncbi:MAG: hypothetical protein ACX94A_05530 [Algiphilus sp.]
MHDVSDLMLDNATRLALTAAGAFLLVGLLTGVWKYWQIAHSAEAQAHPYVDIAHRASLLYSFASLLLAALAWFSVWSDVVNTIAVAASVLFFALAIGSYVLHGVLADTDNQLRTPHRLGSGTLPGIAIHGFMVALIIAEVGGAAVLFAGAMLAIW